VWVFVLCIVRPHFWTSLTVKLQFHMYFSRHSSQELLMSFRLFLPPRLHYSLWFSCSFIPSSMNTDNRSCQWSSCSCQYSCHVASLLGPSWIAFPGFFGSHKAEIMLFIYLGHVSCSQSRTRSTKGLLVLARVDSLAFRPRQDPRPYICSFRTFKMFWNGSSSSKRGRIWILLVTLPLLGSESAGSHCHSFTHSTFINHSACLLSCWWPPAAQRFLIPSPTGPWQPWELSGLLVHAARVRVTLWLTFSANQFVMASSSSRPTTIIWICFAFVYRTCSMLLKILASALYTSPLSVQALQKQIISKSKLCYDRRSMQPEFHINSTQTFSPYLTGNTLRLQRPTG
jgi:hypothetical protein